jgi:hypothetical protein
LQRLEEEEATFGDMLVTSCPDNDVGEKCPKEKAMLQKMLNKKFGANLDVDGIMGPLTLRSINKFMPDAAAGLADQPNRTTAVQGKKIKEESRGRRVARSGPNETAVKEQN